MTLFGVPVERVGRSEAARRIHAAGVAFQRGRALEEETERRVDAERRLAAEAKRQREADRGRQEATLAEITARVQAALDAGTEPPPPKVKDILIVTAIHYGVRVFDIEGQRRYRTISRPRQVAMYLARELTKHSLPEIGHRIGHRDHTTILHGASKIERLIAAGDPVADDVNAIRARLVP